MDLEMLKFRAETLQKIRNFFIQKGFLELDTPALSQNLIPETCLEVFKTEYIKPWSQEKIPLYLVPSPEIYIKKIISKHKVNVFQISKCYRNLESIGNIHNPEFTMLEYYQINKNYFATAKLTEELFEYLLPPKQENNSDIFDFMRPPFLRMKMNDAFKNYVGFKLSDCSESLDLAQKARELGLEESKENPFDLWKWDELYNLIFVHCVEPRIPKNVPVMLMDYPAKSPCLAQEFYKDGMFWKERWELYCNGIELSNCYTEETNPQKIQLYFETEGKLKNQNAKILHAIDENYWKIFKDFPKCSGNAMGIDRLIALLSGHKTIESVLPFSL